METIWKTFLPMTYPNVSSLIDSNMLCVWEWASLLIWTFSRPEQFFSQQRDWHEMRVQFSNQLTSSPQLFRMLAELPYDPSEPFLRRDLIDIARTTTKNLTYLAIANINIAMQNSTTDKKKQENILHASKSLLRHLELFRDLLALHEDYSLNATFERLHTVAEVNPCFAKTLVANAANSYCASYQYELFDHLYLPIARAYVDVANTNAKKGASISPDELQALQKVYDKAFETIRNTPLHEMKSRQVSTAKRYREITLALAKSAENLLTENYKY